MKNCPQPKCRLYTYYSLMWRTELSKLNKINLKSVLEYSLMMNDVNDKAVQH